MSDNGELPNTPTFQKTTIDKIMAEVERFRRSQSSEEDAITVISEIVYLEGTAAGIEPSKCRDACKSYVESIREISRDLERRVPLATRQDGNGSREGNDDNGGERPSNRIGNREPTDPIIRSDQAPPRGEVERQLRRARDQLEEDGDDDAERPSKRTFDEKLLPWTSSSSHSSYLPAALVESNRLKSNYRADLPTSLLRLHDAMDLPQFPRPLWKDLLQGFYVDFDKLSSTIRSISGDATEPKRLGEFEIHSDSVKITRRVTDKLEWVEAYSMYAEAVKFAFPCREKELLGYGHNIAKLFTGTAPRFHCTVLEYDRAVRTRVGRSNNFQLTDSAEFDDLAKAHMSPIGIAAQSTFGYQSKILSPAKAPRLPTTPTTGEVCIRFNMGRKHGDRCPHKHCCRLCHSTEHGECDCPRRSGDA